MVGQLGAADVERGCPGGTSAGSATKLNCASGSMNRRISQAQAALAALTAARLAQHALFDDAQRLRPLPAVTGL